MLCTALLIACGGADSSVTTISGYAAQQHAIVNTSAYSPNFLQKSNNMPITVDAGPGGGFNLGLVNILYATVTVCSPNNANNCTSIDHVQVDTGSIGLRLLASKVAMLNLPPVVLTDPSSGAVLGNALECYPFVIGGFWGPTVSASITLGLQTISRPIPIHLIQDDTANSLYQPPADCVNASTGGILSSASSLGSNGILGIGSVIPDCGSNCVTGNYGGSYVQYYSCPPGAITNAQCIPAKIPLNFQVSNPIAWLANDNNGVVISLPNLTGLGAGVANGELIFGIGTQTNNVIPLNTKKTFLGTDPSQNSYLGVNTLYQGQLITNSYLDTGTNGLFFNDANINRCLDSSPSWYCPAKPVISSAILSDGMPSTAVGRVVNFQVDDAGVLFFTGNTAVSTLAGVAVPVDNVPYFAWGLPFFYGKTVYLSIWDPSVPNQTPWYAF